MTELPAKDLRAIRAALTLPQDLEGFDVGLEVALGKVRAGLDAGQLEEFIDTWWRIACDAARDPGGRREMYERAERARELAARGEPLPHGDKAWRELLDRP